MIARLLAAALGCLALNGHGQSLGGFNLADFSFDITTYTPQGPAGGGGSTASGVSNGIGWSISPTSLWTGRTTIDGSFVFPGLPATTDSLHVGQDFTITFDSPISGVVFALTNDNGVDSLNLFLQPALLQNVVQVPGVPGHQLNLQVAGFFGGGGFAVFEGLNTTTLMHIDNNGADGFDIAFHAIPAPVPEPSALLLGLFGLLTLAAMRVNGAR